MMGFRIFQIMNFRTFALLIVDNIFCYLTDLEGTACLSYHFIRNISDTMVLGGQEGGCLTHIQMLLQYH